MKNNSAGRWNGKFSIATALMLVFGLLTFVSVGSLFGMGIWLAQKNTFSLLSENAYQGVGTAVSGIQQYLKPVEQMAGFLARRIQSGELDSSNLELLYGELDGALAGAEQVEVMMYIDPQLFGVVARKVDAEVAIVNMRRDYTNDPLAQYLLENPGPGAHWGKPIRREPTGKTYFFVSYPVFVGDGFGGAVVAAVPVQKVSEFVGRIALHPGGRMFILLGRDHVLAHSEMRSGYPEMSSDQPLPLVTEFSDPVLAAMWQPDKLDKTRLTMPEGTLWHAVEVEGQKYLFVYQQLFEFGEQPLYVGAYFPRSQFAEEVQRMVLAIIVGIIGFLLSLLIAIFIGRKIAEPIMRFSAATSAIRDLDLSQVEELPGSRLRELNDQSAAFNAMLGALRWFEMYVPNRIVAHLVKQGDAGKTVSHARNITVMFTDIVGFSRLSEGMSAQEVARLLNHHFSLIGHCINNENGTIDKYIGDAVMAFWGAPERLKNRAEHACRAALAIARAIHEDNQQRVSLGGARIAIRIGIHTGEMTVGNIGTPDRINYTIIGDAVNVGERLEQLGKEIFTPDKEVSILISADTARDLGDSFQPRSVGIFKLKGREQEIEVFSLEPEV